MAKIRLKIPKAVSDRVLHEYNHKCSLCHSPGPHLHHIDEDPSNNEDTNLIPLCPNCHLSGQHGRFCRHTPQKMALFRVHKEPAILMPQFDSLLARVHFLFALPDFYTRQRLHDDFEDLQAFVRCMEMGDYYADSLSKILRLEPYRNTHERLVDFEDEQDLTEKQREARHRREETIECEWAASQRAALELSKEQIIRLLVESLRFQKWASPYRLQ